jgi:hypothetical protein
MDSHVWWVIVYRQFHNYDGVIFLYCHVSDSNYHLLIDTETFLFGFICFRWTRFYRPYSISDFPVSVTDRIKTYTSENGESIFPIVFTLRLSILTINVVVIFIYIEYVLGPDPALIPAVTKPPSKWGIRLQGSRSGDSRRSENATNTHTEHSKS